MNSLFSVFQAIPQCPQAVIFDYDGTIARVPIDWARERPRFREMMLSLHLGIDIPEDLRVDDMEALVLRETTLPRREIFAYRQNLESALSGTHEPLEQTLEFIDSLKSILPQLPLIILSNSLTETVLSGLSQLGRTDDFIAVYGVDAIGLPKPATTAARVLRDNHNLKLRNCLFVGDSISTDGAFAENLGIPFINIKNLNP